MQHISDWIVPDKSGDVKYTIHSNTFYIKTESAIGADDVLGFSLFTDDDKKITNYRWRLDDWAYIVNDCTPEDWSLKFPVTPPTDVEKTWEVTATAEAINIKCNTLEVLHFIYRNSYNGQCENKAKGKTPTSIQFRMGDAASKLFKSELVGK